MAQLGGKPAKQCTSSLRLYILEVKETAEFNMKHVQPFWESPLNLGVSFGSKMHVACHEEVMISHVRSICYEHEIELPTLSSFFTVLTFLHDLYFLESTHQYLTFVIEFFWACSIIHRTSPRKCSGYNCISLCKGKVQLCPNLSHELHSALLGNDICTDQGITLTKILL